MSHARALTLALLVAGSAGVQAGRPLQTEDPDILEASDCELEAALGRSRGPVLRSSARSIQLSCGVGQRLQLALGASGGGGADRAEGLGVRAKLGLIDGGEAGISWTLALAVERERRPGASWRRRGESLTLVGVLPLGGLGEGARALANLGVSHEGAGGWATHWNVAVELAPLSAAGLGLTPMAELVGDPGEATWAHVGLRLTVLPQRLWVDGSAGRQLGHPHVRLTTLGLKLAF